MAHVLFVLFNNPSLQIVGNSKHIQFELNLVRIVNHRNKHTYYFHDLITWDASKELVLEGAPEEYEIFFAMGVYVLMKPKTKENE